MEGDLVAEGLELADVGSDGALGSPSLVVVVGAQIDELGFGVASRSSGIFFRIEVRAIPARTSGSRSPPINAAIIARPDIPKVRGDHRQLDPGVFQELLAPVLLPAHRQQ